MRPTLNLELFPIHEFSSRPARGRPRLGVWGLRWGQNRPNGLEPRRGVDVWAGALPGAPFHVDLSVFIPLNFISSSWLGQLLSLPLDSAAPLQGGPTDTGVHPPLCRVHICPPSLTRASDSSCS